jgi:uncharacterized membrane protein YfcA
MTSYVVVCVVALAASWLTLISGFGLGTLLLPAFALVFPLEIAVSATAVVHLLNNLFKLTLVGRWGQPRLVAAFGIPAAIGAFGGAWVLRSATERPPLTTWTAAGRTFDVTATGLLVGSLVLAFAVAEFRGTRGAARFGRRWIPVGGLLSGLFGGLSGHQGALRSTFLLQAGLTKERFIATGVWCAVLVDCSRLSVYGPSFFSRHFEAIGGGDGLPLMVAATFSAFAGAFAGTRLLHKVTLESVHRLVGGLLVLFGLAMAAGIL